MTDYGIADKLRSVLAGIDPRRSLVASAMWLIIALAVTFSVAAAVWVGGIARQNVLQQHIRRLSLETDQLSSELGQALSARLDAVRAAGPILRATIAPGRRGGLGGVFDELVSAYPQLGWIAVADSNGIVVRSNGAMHQEDDVNASPWFSSGLHGPWLGVMGETSRPQAMPTANAAEFGDMAIPVREETGRIVGVIAVHVSWRRAAHHPERLTDESDPRAATEAYVLDRDGIVLIGPETMLHKPWNGVAVDEEPSIAPAEPFRMQRKRRNSSGSPMDGAFSFRARSSAPATK